ncbi:MAG: bifunctional [glutamate--ammonia ligase]-adenylyl-L-tyrosine phosphorylase/[glutamate--ammonia-ligase] adenylyltransferase [Pseudohongiellaceae bacterium]
MQLAPLSDDRRNVIGLYHERLQAACEESDDAGRLCRLLEEDSALAERFDRVLMASDYAANVCISHPDLLLALHDDGLLEGGGRDDIDGLLAARLQPLVDDQDDSGGEVTLKEALRLFQQQQMLRLIWRDVCRVTSVRDLCGEISALAETVLEQTLDLLHGWCVREWGEPIGEDSDRPQRLVVIGMGKFGAGELNLSSDIDLIFAYPEAGTVQTPDGAGDMTNQQFFLRLGQQLIDALDTVTVDGFVYRVDMRLRPYGSDGVLVSSFDAMENYYQLQGRDWERYAMIKARVVAGDHESGAALLQRLRPFVYRRYLDFSAFESLRGLKLQINKQVRRKGRQQDIKLGQGGIREAEFVVQALQLVHGGRDHSLQEPSLYRAMEAIREAEYLPAELIDELDEAYTFLRDLEHKLQGYANKQTQALPSSEKERQRVAFAMGYEAWASLENDLRHHRDTIHEHFNEVIRTEEEDEAEHHQVEEGPFPALWRGDFGEERAVAALEQSGFEDPKASWQLLDGFHSDRQFRTLPEQSRQRFDRFMPLMLATLAGEKTPSLGLTRVMQMVEAVARRTAYLVLLVENPGAMRQFVRLCTASPFIAEFLSQHPVLLDELLDGIDEPPGKNELQDELTQGLLRIDPQDLDSQMEYLRYFKLSHTLQVAAAQVTGTMTVMKVSDYLTFTAEAVLEKVLALAWDTLQRKHGHPVNSEGRHGEMDFVVLGYGKLGGIELSYLSDLDIVFLHDGALEQETIASDGQKAINSREFYTRLAQRMITMLETQTISGRLYEVDMRLRPSGESGLLVSSLTAFRKYQEEEAWTWEHQALVRARAVAGSQRLASAFTDLRAAVLSAQRDPEKLCEQVLSMRGRMRRELTRKAGSKRERPPFRIKQGPGGIVDIEFLVQYLVLSRSSDCPDLLRWPDNIRILEEASKHGVMDGEQPDELIEAYLALRGTLHRYALHEAYLENPLEALQPHFDTVHRVWISVFGESADPASQESPAEPDEGT